MIVPWESPRNRGRRIFSLTEVADGDYIFRNGITYLVESIQSADLMGCQGWEVVVHHVAGSSRITRRDWWPHVRQRELYFLGEG